MSQMILNYLMTDSDGYNVIAKNCYRWRSDATRNVADVIGEILAGDGLIGLKPRKGLHVFGNMYNPDKGFEGEIWVSAPIVSVEVQDDLTYVITSSGSKYYLFYPFGFSSKEDSDDSDDLGDLPDSCDLHDDVPEPTTEEVFKDPIGYLNYLSAQ